jgi:hypothetical protein
MRAGVEVVRAALVRRETGSDHAVECRHQRGGTVDHRRVDDLSPARALRLKYAADDPESQIKGTAGEVADQVQGRGRRLAAPPESVQRADQRDVVDVVPRRVRQRPVLPPAGHPAVDETRVAGEAVIGAEAQPLGDAGTEPLDQRVGAFDKAQCESLAVRTLQVERQGSAAAQ